MWLDGFEQKAASTKGGTFDGSPWRLVLHTTEGGSIEGAIASFAATGSWPHFTVDAATGRKIQHYPLSTSARALAHPKGTPETNRAGAIQIEIVGYASDSPGWPEQHLDWLGREVVGPIRAARPFPLTYPQFVGPESGTIASARAPQRFTEAEWAQFSGVCGHQHVPFNDHWDPGRLDVARIVAAVDPSPPPVHPEDDLTPDQDKRLTDVEHLSEATNAAVGRLEVAIGDPTNGLYVKHNALEAKVDRLLKKLGA